jgi:hypothetical protein
VIILSQGVDLPRKAVVIVVGLRRLPLVVYSCADGDLRVGPLYQFWVFRLDLRLLP